MISIPEKYKDLILETIEESLYKIALEMDNFKGGPMTPERKKRHKNNRLWMVAQNREPTGPDNKANSEHSLPSPRNMPSGRKARLASRHMGDRLHIFRDKEYICFCWSRWSWIHFERQ